eukprot:6331438-Prymnesium_polylepis.1
MADGRNPPRETGLAPLRRPGRRGCALWTRGAVLVILAQPGPARFCGPPPATRSRALAAPPQTSRTLCAAN